MFVNYKLQDAKLNWLLVRRLSAAEAQGMDPQNRVLLEQAALALGDAAPATGPLQDTPTGVYIGCMYQVSSSTGAVGPHTEYPDTTSLSSDYLQVLDWSDECTHEVLTPTATGVPAAALQPGPQDHRHRGHRQRAGLLHRPPVLHLRAAGVWC